MIYWQLFISFFKIGVFAIGGGYATLPLIEKEIIYGHHWLSLQEFYQIVTIANMTPGPVGINTATFVGYQVQGLPGSIVATAAVVLPSLIIVSLLYYLFKKYMEKGEERAKRFFNTLNPIVLALILTAAISVAKGGIFDFKTFLIAIISFALTVYTKINVLYILLASGIAGVVMYYL